MIIKNTTITTTVIINVQNKIMSRFYVMLGNLANLRMLLW